MSCHRCKSKRIAEVSAKCSDMCSIDLGDSSINDYVPNDMGIGSGDYLEFSYCLDCGQLQGNFPLASTRIEKEISDVQVAEFFDNHFTEGANIVENSRQQHDLIQWAETESYQFGVFIRDYFDYNTGRKPERKHPSVGRFVQMFRGKDADLADSERFSK